MSLGNSPIYDFSNMRLSAIPVDLMVNTKLSAIRQLYLSNNLLTSLQALSQAKSLSVLDVSANKLSKLDALKPLSSLSLNHLAIVANPLTRTVNYLFSLIELLPQLKTVSYQDLLTGKTEVLQLNKNRINLLHRCQKQLGRLIVAILLYNMHLGQKLRDYKNPNQAQISSLNDLRQITEKFLTQDKPNTVDNCCINLLESCQILFDRLVACVESFHFHDGSLSLDMKHQKVQKACLYYYNFVLAESASSKHKFSYFSDFFIGRLTVVDFQEEQNLVNSNFYSSAVIFAQMHKYYHSTNKAFQGQAGTSKVAKDVRSQSIKWQQDNQIVFFCLDFCYVEASLKVLTESIGRLSRNTTLYLKAVQQAMPSVSAFGSQSNIDPMKGYFASQQSQVHSKIRKSWERGLSFPSSQDPQANNPLAIASSTSLTETRIVSGFPSFVGIAPNLPSTLNLGQPNVTKSVWTTNAVILKSVVSVLNLTILKITFQRIKEHKLAIQTASNLLQKILGKRINRTFAFSFLLMKQHCREKTEAEKKGRKLTLKAVFYAWMNLPHIRRKKISQLLRKIVKKEKAVSYYWLMKWRLQASRISLSQKLRLALREPLQGNEDVQKLQTNAGRLILDMKYSEMISQRKNADGCDRKEARGLSTQKGPKGMGSSYSTKVIKGSRGY